MFFRGVPRENLTSFEAKCTLKNIAFKLQAELTIDQFILNIYMYITFLASKWKNKNKKHVSSLIFASSS